MNLDRFKNLKVAIGIPSNGYWLTDFATNYCNMIVYFQSHKVGDYKSQFLQTISTKGSILPKSRREIVKIALEMKANYLLWLDTDHTFPRNMLHRLINHNKDVVGANCVTKCIPAYPTARYKPKGDDPVQGLGMLAFIISPTTSWAIFAALNRRRRSEKWKIRRWDKPLRELMAKKTKAKNVVDTCGCPAAIGDYKPRLYLDLQDKSVEELKGLKIGEDVEVMVKGRLVELSQRERTEGKDKVKTGSISLENYELMVVEDDQNLFAKLAAEDSGEDSAETDEA